MAGVAPRHRCTDLNGIAITLGLGGFRAEILGWGFFEQRWWRNYLHSHSFFEICYAFAGRGTFRSLGVDHTVRAGEVFVAKPGEPHEIISSEDDPLGIYFWSYTLLPAERRTTEGVDALLDGFLTSRRWVSDRVEMMQATLELLTEEIVQRRPGYGLVAEGLVAKLLLDTARAVVEDAIPADRTGPAARSPAEALTQRMIAYLRDNYRRPLTVRDVAAQVHLSERHTSRLFRQVVGRSIGDYLTDLRLEIAAQLLLNQQLSIGEVAAASGYPDVRYFVTLFHRQMGVTPGRFRRTNGTRLLAPPT